MADSGDQWNTSDKRKILSDDDSSLESFDLTTPQRPSYYEPSEDCLPYIQDDPICDPSKTPNPNHGEQPNQPISADDQVTKPNDSHMNQPPPAYSPQSLDYLNHAAHNDLPSAPTSSYYRGPVVQGQYDNTYPNPQPYYLPQQSQATQQQQPQVIYVGFEPPVIPVNVDNSDLECSIVGAIVLSIFSLLFCIIFGAFAIRCAIRAQQAAKNGNRADAIQLRNSSYGLSIAGIIVGGAVTGIYIYLQSQRWK